VSELESLRARLEREFGAQALDGFALGPRGESHLRVTPRGEEQLAAALALAGEARVAVVPTGAGSKLGWTARPERGPLLLLSTRGLCGIVAHEPADGTLAALSGTSMAELRAATLAGGHALTPDVPRAERATLGGVVAAGESGWDRERFGPVRQHVLGARVLLSDGTRARSGGRLVKNVTGFDLQRLYTGSHGTLCVILEVALRLFPAPEHEALVVTTAADASELLELAARVRASEARPWALVAARDRGWSLWARLAGKPAALAAELALLRSAWPACAVLAGEEARAEHAALREKAFEAGTSGWLRGSVPPAALARALGALERRLDEARGEARLWVQPGQGAIDVEPRGERADALAATLVAAWRADLTALEGPLEWRNAPPERRTPQDVFGPPPAGLALRRALRRGLDPAGRFASGRLAGGL
jgi:glycolate oxidase FAD binding subunit